METAFKNWLFGHPAYKHTNFYDLNCTKIIKRVPTYHYKLNCTRNGAIKKSLPYFSLYLSLIESTSLLFSYRKYILCWLSIQKKQTLQLSTFSYNSATHLCSGEPPHLSKCIVDLCEHMSYILVLRSPVFIFRENENIISTKRDES